MRYLLVAIALALSACASSGTEVKDSQLTQFQKGVTTQRDVIEALGAPTATSSGSNGFTTLVYSGAHAHAKAASYIPVVGIFAGGATGEGSSVAFVFGPDGKLLSYTSSHSNINSGLGAH